MLKFIEKIKKNIEKRKEFKEEERKLLSKLSNLEEAREKIEIKKQEEYDYFFVEIKRYANFETGEIIERTRPTNDELKCYKKIIERYDQQIWYIEKDMEKVKHQLRELRKN